MNEQPQRESDAIQTCPAQTQSATHFGAGRVAVFPLSSGRHLVRGVPARESVCREKELLSLFAAPLVAFSVEQSARVRAMDLQNAIAAGSREPMQDCSDGR